MSEIEDRARNLIAKQLDVPPEKVVREANFVKDLGADSLDVAESVMNVEEEFSCQIPDDVAEKMDTFGALVEFLEANVKA